MVKMLKTSYKPDVLFRLARNRCETHPVPPLHPMSTLPFQVPEIGQIEQLLPAFEFEHLIARGGMGAVYKARQRSLDRDVAIKILPRELGEDPVFRDSFQAEAKAMARLAHPNLIRVYDSGDVDGLLYIVMEYVPGKSLYHSAYGKAIQPEQAVRITLSACRGLAHAHQNGIVHRDIKPGNILLTPECEPKIGDFGLARCIRSNARGLAMGTPAYMAPEIVHQPETGNVKSDVYSVGVLLRELLTGISAENPAARSSMVSDPRLAVICRKATHENPALRYRDASAFAEDLERWLAGGTSGIKSAAPSPAFNAPKPAVRSPLAAARPIRTNSTPTSQLKNIALIAVLLGAIFLVHGIYQIKKENISRLQTEESAKPKVVKIVNLQPDETASISYTVSYTNGRPILVRDTE